VSVQPASSAIHINKLKERTFFLIIFSLSGKRHLIGIAMPASYYIVLQTAKGHLPF
jgi:hypothetical protein